MPCILICEKTAQTTMQTFATKTSTQASTAHTSYRFILRRNTLCINDLANRSSKGYETLCKRALNTMQLVPFYSLKGILLERQETVHPQIGWMILFYLQLQQIITFVNHAPFCWMISFYLQLQHTNERRSCRDIIYYVRTPRRGV